MSHGTMPEPCTGTKDHPASDTGKRYCQNHRWLAKTDEPPILTRVSKFQTSIRTILSPHRKSQQSRFCRIYKSSESQRETECMKKKGIPITSGSTQANGLLHKTRLAVMSGMWKRGNMGAVGTRRRNFGWICPLTDRSWRLREVC